MDQFGICSNISFGGDLRVYLMGFSVLLLVVLLLEVYQLEISSLYLFNTPLLCLKTSMCETQL